MGRNEWAIGDLVWAKMKGFPPWPGRIANPLPSMKKPKGQKAVHCVYFFGSNNFAWIESYCIQPYLECRDKLINYNKTVAFKDAVAAIERYITAKKAGEEVDAEFDQAAGIVGGVGDEVGGEEALGEEEDDNKDDVMSNASSRNRSRRVSKASSHDGSLSLDVKIEPAPSPARKRKSVQENGDSAPTAKAARKPRKSKAAVGAATTFAKANASAAAQRKSAADNLLNRETYVSKPAAKPLDIGSVSQILKDKKIQASDLKFGFLGLGSMGAGIVKNLINSGHKVIVWNRTPEKCKDFVEAGADQGMTPSDVVSTADIIFGCVTDDLAAKEMVLGNCGVLSEITPNKAYVEMTGIDAEASLDTADAISSKGGRYLEAQIQGNKTGAENGTLIILAAGERSVYDECKSAFSAMAQHTYYLGEIGSAAKMNLVLQLIQGISVTALSEGMALADRANLDPKHVLEILGLTPFGNKMIEEKGAAIMAGSYAAQHSLQYMQKDLNMALQLGNKLDQPLPVTASANEVYKHAKRLGYGEHDASAVYIRARF